MTQRGEANLHLVLTIFLGFGMVLFGVLAVVAFERNNTTQANVEVIKANVANRSKAAQKQSDVAANIKANELPYRTYMADPVDGGFELQIPKNWSLYAAKNTSKDQLMLIANPEAVKTDQSSSAINTYGFELELQNRAAGDIARSYQQSIKKNLVLTKGVTVSGIQGVWYQGQIDTQRHTGIVVVLPVRDKIMVITTHSLSFQSEFQKILDSAKIIP